MSKSLTLTLVTIAVIAIAAVIILKKPAAPSDNNTNGVTPTGMTQTNDNPNGPDYQPGRDTQNGAQGDTNGKKMSFDVFMKQGLQGSAYECTVHQTISNIDTTGKVWIDGTGTATSATSSSANAKVHGEFTTAVQGMNITSNFTVVDGYSYSWSSMMSTGYKVKVPDSTGATSDTSAEAKGSYSWNASQIGDYDCQPWTATAAKFALPTNIKFTEMSAK